jgi:ligand-binding SRPBCC domain-containing protein
MDTTNIKQITPPDTNVEILDISLPLHKGSVVKIKATKFFIPQIWEVEIAEAIPDVVVEDRALKSPFALWVHKHKFEAIDASTSRLCDEIELKLPFGILGKLAMPLVLLDIKKMFAYRHKKTKEILEKTHP